MTTMAKRFRDAHAWRHVRESLLMCLRVGVSDPSQVGAPQNASHVYKLLLCPIKKNTIGEWLVMKNAHIYM